MVIYIPNDSIRDTKMRWDGTMVRLVADDGSKLPLYISSIEAVSSTRVTMLVNILYADGWMPERKTIRHDSLDLSHPKVGYFNRGKSAYRLTRCAKDRVYRLGMSTVRMSATAPNARELSYLDEPPAVDVMDCARYVYDREFPSCASAYKEIVSGNKYSVAISYSIALGVSDSAKDVAVYRNNKLIGEINEDLTVYLPAKHRYFSEELEELGLTVAILEQKDA